MNNPFRLSTVGHAITQLDKAYRDARDELHATVSAELKGKRVVYSHDGREHVGWVCECSLSDPRDVKVRIGSRNSAAKRWIGHYQIVEVLDDAKNSA